MADKKIEQRLGLEPFVTDEYYRVLFSNVERKIHGSQTKSIAVTSTVSGEGKTTTVIQLAKVAVRDFGKKVLLLEGDFRNPQLHLLVKAASKTDRAIVESTIKGLDVMPLEKTTRNLSIKGPAFANGLKIIIDSVCNTYDYVFVDCPPILPLVDMQIIGGVVDGIILVVRAEGPDRNMILNGIEGLPKQKILGIVFNGAKLAWPKANYNYTY
jgi:capsular exopolysaccharide synthesis family protein